MPSGAAVVRYDGKHGVVWRIKYTDADGKQIQETLGREPEWTEKKANAELRERLVRVQRQGYRRPTPVTFESFAVPWVDEHVARKGLKASTAEGYRTIINRHLIPALGHLRLDQVNVARVEQYVAEARGRGLQPRTVNLHLNALSVILKTAHRRGLITSNPIGSVDRPRPPRRNWTILTPAEVGRVARAFENLAQDENTPEAERAWIRQARVVFLVVLYVGLRRGEILGLRWRHVHLADPDGARLEVRETVVHGRADTPKSKRGVRTIALGPVISDELFQHRARTSYAGDDEYVFCHTEKGTPLDHKRYATTLRAALKEAGVDRAMRPFHDGRHSSISNAAAAGMSPAALMARAGHADFQTTQIYIDLAGETFRHDAELLEQRLSADPVQEIGTNSPPT